ncbi:MAG TPA: DUF4389 domain-containing protein [Ilumatobacteraceae bacterium]|nr:DUF4389 domain-containing protein [Ilumatobacteraceae bacterium]
MSAVSFDITYTTPRNRLTNAFRLIWAIPHLIIVNVLSRLAQVLALVQWFIVLFTGKRNRGLWDLGRNCLSWEVRANAYAMMLYDTYPNFGFEKKDEPVEFGLEWDDSVDRLSVALRIIYAIPALFILIFVGIGAFFVALGTWFAILFTGNQPRGMFDFLVKVERFGARLSAYLYLLTDTYPKFE